MDSASRLVTVDIDAQVQAVARELCSDSRIFELADGREFIRTQQHQSFDLVFADAWAGKYDGLDDALALVRHGGFFIGDDMLPQANWRENHQERAEGLVTYLEGLQGWTTVTLSWGSGFVIAVRL
jgi:predicted O-methyltransferase YrrM